SAEISGERSQYSADQECEADQQDGEWNGNARAPEDAAENVAAEVVGPKQVLDRRRLVQAAALVKRVIRREPGRHHRNGEPRASEHESDDGQWLEPRR